MSSWSGIMISVYYFSSRNGEQLSILSQKEYAEHYTKLRLKMHNHYHMENGKYSLMDSLIAINLKQLCPDNNEHSARDLSNTIGMKLNTEWNKLGQAGTVNYKEVGFESGSRNFIQHKIIYVVEGQEAMLQPSKVQCVNQVLKPKSMCNLYLRKGFHSDSDSHLPTDDYQLLSQEKIFTWFSTTIKSMFPGGMVNVEDSAVTLVFEDALNNVVHQALLNFSIGVRTETVQSYLREMNSPLYIPSSLSLEEIQFVAICRENYWRISPCLCERSYVDKLDDKQNAIYHNLKVGNIYCYLYNMF